MDFIIGALGGLMVGHAIAEAHGWQIKAIGLIGLVLVIVSQHM